MEIMIVISLISILTASGGFYAFTQIRKGYDAKRKFHLSEFAKAFENYYNDHECYPSTNEWDDAVCDSSNSFLLSYQKMFFCDPEFHSKYVYIPTDKNGNLCEGSCGQCYGYRLYAVLSNKSDPSIAGVGCNNPNGCGYTDEKGRNVNYGVASGDSVSSKLALLKGDEYTDLTRNIVFNLTTTPAPAQSHVKSLDRPPAEPQIIKKILVLDYNPIVKDGKTLRNYKNWPDPLSLEKKFIEDIASASGKFLKYEISTRVDNIDEFPAKDDGYIYSDEEYLALLNNQQADFVSDAAVNYLPIIEKYDLCSKSNAGQINEVWIWSGPEFGFYPVVEAGDEAKYIGSPPITDSTCTNKLTLMSFRYDQDLTSMIKIYGLRTENVLSNIFNEYLLAGVGPTTDWGKFTKLEAWFKNESVCGLPAFPPNAYQAGDFSNSNSIQNSCDNWIFYPILANTTTNISCAKWGCNKYGYLLWWFSHLPRIAGSTDGFLNNWWKYIIN